MRDIAPLLDFLPCRTPDAWVQRAVQEMELILLDHAANEMKAAQSAMTLIAKNPGRLDLLNKMSRLAREELVHFEQVLKILRKRGIKYRPIRASRYASRLGKHIRKTQQENFIDTLIVGAIIEARSCERFYRLAPHLDMELQKFYLSLLKSEARHFRDYLALARDCGDPHIDGRIEHFLAVEADAIQSPDPQLRFHSGLPVTQPHSASQENSEATGQ